MMLNVDDGCSVLLSFFFGKASLYISLKISLNGMKIVCIFFPYEQNIFSNVWWSGCRSFLTCIFLINELSKSKAKHYDLLYSQTPRIKKNNFIIVHTNVKLFNSIIIYKMSNCLKLIPRWNYSFTHSPRLKKHTNYLKLIR